MWSRTLRGWDLPLLTDIKDRTQILTICKIPNKWFRCLICYEWFTIKVYNKKSYMVWQLGFSGNNQLLSISRGDQALRNCYSWPTALGNSFPGHLPYLVTTNWLFQKSPCKKYIIEFLPKTYRLTSVKEDSYATRTCWL
jgi:hypothetical protein